MSILSPHLRELQFGRRRINFDLQDGKVVADSSTEENPADNNKLVLHMADGSVSLANTQDWNIPCAQGDVITLLQVSSAKARKKKPVLAAIINRSQRERRRIQTLSTILRGAKVSRAFIWWFSFIFLGLSAIITEYGFFARRIDAFLSPLQGLYSGPLSPYIMMISKPFNALMRWLPLPFPGGSASASSMFGSLQDHGAIIFSALFLLILILGYRSLRILTVPLFAYCLYCLKISLFGFDQAQGAVLIWYAPVLGLLVITGFANFLRDRWRLSMRLSAICKSQMAQPLPQSMMDSQAHEGEEPPAAHSEPQDVQVESPTLEDIPPASDGVEDVDNTTEPTEAPAPQKDTTPATEAEILVAETMAESEKTGKAD
jgi:hypothetical protein